MAALQISPKLAEQGCAARRALVDTLASQLAPSTRLTFATARLSHGGLKRALFVYDARVDAQSEPMYALAFDDSELIWFDSLDALVDCMVHIVPPPMNNTAPTLHKVQSTPALDAALCAWFGACGL